MKNGNEDDIRHKRAIIAIFINAVYLYDDRATIIFNATDRPVSVDYDLILDKMDKSSYNKGNQSVCKDMDGVERGSYMTTTAPA